MKLDGSDNRNVILCGFMGCGKTTLGPLLAAQMGRPFLDADLYIEEKAGLRIPEIFRFHGEPDFRDREHQAIRELSTRRGLVLSVGGGAPTFPRNVPFLQANSALLYLNPGFDECYARIKDSDRPLVAANTRAQLEALYTARHPMYRAAAHLELVCGGAPEAWLEAALRLLAGF